MAEGKQFGLAVGQFVTSQLGGKWTPQKARFFDAWARAEGTSASFNPFATTRRGYPGETSFNSVGVKNYPTLAVGQRATLQTLQNGYYDHIVELLKDQDVSAEQLAAAVANSPWGTGAGVLRVLGSKLATGYEQTKARTGYAAKRATIERPFQAAAQVDAMRENAERQAAHDLASRLIQHTNTLLAPSEGWLNTLSRLGSGGQRVADMARAFTPLEAPAPPEMVPVPTYTPEPTAANKSASKFQPTGKSGFINTSRGWRETPHAGGRTSGLGWGDDVPADIMGPPGTKIGAPADGKIEQIGSAQEGGKSYTLVGDDGHEYWLGHIETLVPVGARVKANQVIATISGEHPRPHLHITRRKIR